MGNLVIVYNAKDKIISREYLDLQNDDAIGNALDIVGSQTNMYLAKSVGYKNDQKLVIYYNDRIDWQEKESYNPLGFMGQVFNNIFLVAAYDPKTQEAVDIKMKPTEAFREVKNFEAAEFGWDIRFN
tara:strand:- start:122 stop:502 length:381 start_codon:yes stop_codon:yes gene_type:complete